MIEIQKLNKIYESKSRNANHVLHDITLTLPDTGFVCIVGTSGCGKTSLLNAISGLDHFDNGTISTGNTKISRSGTKAYEQERNNSFSYIFQNYYLLSDHSVAYNIYLGLHSLGLTHSEKITRVKESLKAVNMSRYGARMVSELSGGQQQRVAIARALARRPKVIFADEPTGNLDEENTIHICSILRKISKTSLIVMVTHEQNIANFFADRIITLKEGRIVNDETEWKRDNLTPNISGTLYTDDYPSQEASANGINLRVLTQENALPVNLTIAVLQDKIIIKTDDSRMISCSKFSETPVLVEGTRPIITLDSVENTPALEDIFSDSTSHQPVKAEKGLSLSMMLQEALRLIRSKSIHLRIARIFLAFITILTIWIVGDYLTVSSIDPHDFIITDSNTFDMSAGYGPKPVSYDNYALQNSLYNLYKELEKTDVPFRVMPLIGSRVSFTADTFPQLQNLSVELTNFSYAPMEYLEESTLIYGRMPENSNEIVVDRWVLDKSLSQDGIIQNGITDASQLLGTQLNFFKKKYTPTIVGICNCDKPTIYLSKVAFASLANMGTEVILLSDLQNMYPGTYDDVTLEADECIVITNNAGEGYLYKIGQSYRTNTLYQFTIADAFPIENTYQSLVLSEAGVDTLLDSINMMNLNPTFYSPEKETFKRTLLSTLKGPFDGQISYTITDLYEQSMTSYKEAAMLKADARIIITISVIVLGMIMLYLLQRSYVQQRLGMIAVYRLLGIPGRKLIGIFSLESIFLSLKSTIPVMFLTWIIITIMNHLTDLNFSMVMPFHAGLSVGLCILLYYLLISLLPVCRLLKLPPARLAAKYDL